MTDLARNSIFGERFAYGGVSFELLADFDACRPSGSLSRCLHDGPTYANVWCEVRRGRLYAANSNDPIGDAGSTWADSRWNGHRMSFALPGMRGELTDLGARYAATARLGSPENISLLVEKIADAVRARSRAVTFRASALAVHDRVHVLLGDPALVEPSLFRDHGFARDRVAVARLGSEWRAWRLAGDFDQPASLPLGSISIVTEEGLRYPMTSEHELFQMLTRRVQEDSDTSFDLLRALVSQVDIKSVSSGSLAATLL